MSVIRPTHSVSLHVQVGDPERLKEIRNRFALQLKALPDDIPYSNLTVFNLDGIAEDDDGGEFFDENTVVKVHQALREAVKSMTYSPESIDFFVEGLINSMQNYGILFREQRNVIPDDESVR